MARTKIRDTQEPEERESFPELEKFLAFRETEHVPTELQEGDKLGPYRLIELLGHGAFGEVWRGFDRTTKVESAIKVFVPGKFELESVELAAERFCSGSVAMTRLREATQVVPIYQSAQFSDGRLWFSMKYFEGRDLTRYLAKNEWSDADSARVIEDLIEGVRAAHTADPSPILHRDLRPENILIEKTATGPKAVLADFDIAYYEEQLRKQEKTGVLLGNHRYLPPDVLKAGNPAMAMKRSQNDLYALAVVAFDLIVGEQLDIPTDARGFASVLRERVRGGESFSSQTRKNLANFFAKALSPISGERFENIREFAEAWGNASRFGIRAFVVAGLAALLWTVGILIACDYWWHQYGDSFGGLVWLRAVTMVLTALGLSVSTVLLVLFSPVRSPRVWRIPSQVHLPTSDRYRCCVGARRVRVGRNN